MALTKMDTDCGVTLSQAHPETMDFLSLAWCNFAVQAFEHEIQDRSLVVQDSPIRVFENDSKLPPMGMDKSVKIDDAENFVPPWKTNDLKSWIWMQQAMHPELNYSSYFKRKWMPWKIMPFKNVPIKKWLKDIKQRRKEEKRLQKAEVHAALSIAGVAAALAAIAAEKSQNYIENTTKESAVASATALIAAQCAKVAEAMGAKREQISSVINSAISSTSASEIVTLTAAAATSIRGSDTLKARSGYKNRFNESSPVLPLEDNHDHDFNFEKCRSILAKGAELKIEGTDGRYLLQLVVVILNNEAKVIIKTKKPNMLNIFARQKESVILDLHTELYRDSEFRDAEAGYLVVLTTDKGIIKLDMKNDYERYWTWSSTINHMLMLSTSFTKYELQFQRS
ncbi:VAN3-binding protein [Primulina tabacum]|uniref:VAN3-binding protein n=1 Tax=Primulina tabacum TaxID=48773 RepID=UPI003F5AD773